MINEDNNDVKLDINEDIKPILLTLMNTIQSALFNVDQLGTPIESLVFGFLVGFITSKKGIIFDDDKFHQILWEYNKCIKQSQTIENVFESLKYFLMDGNKEDNVNDNNRNEFKNIDKKSEMFDMMSNNNIIEEKNDMKINITNDNMIIDDNNYHQSNNEQLKESIIELQQCPICFEDFNVLSSLTYCLDCSCIIHYECFNQYVASCVNDNRIPINCPLCSTEVSPAHVLNSLTQANPDLLNKYETFTLNYFALNNANEISCCPTPGCDYMFYFEEGDIHLNCPTCENEYCLNCKVDWHAGISCEEYRHTHDQEALDKDFMNFVKGKQFKKCPKCAMWVEKNEGCNHMTCRCKQQFCYLCGEIYKPSHKCIGKQPIQLRNFHNPFIISREQNLFNPSIQMNNHFLFNQNSNTHNQSAFNNYNLFLNDQYSRLTQSHQLNTNPQPKNIFTISKQNKK